ncbi:MAG: type II toxin-antitoxin system HigB family toxin [Sediminibacterium sp.]|nr:type II toxin-antitoxin system HigB family toxin [Sediminibacterium sp.]MDP3665331.1 type II toxin-antitoxin system HigB family toxin [Sediminibacterium sp.]
MVILIKRTLLVYAEKNATAAGPLNNWYQIVKTANWKSLADIKQIFNNVDYIGNDRYVFNIKGNEYRLVTMLFFSTRTVYIRFIGTHAEYDKIDCTII